MRNADGQIPDPAHEAISRRLAKLREQPISTSVLDARLKSILPPGATDGEPAPRMRFWTRRSVLSAVAAMLVAALTVLSAFTILAPRPVFASPQEMAVIHESAVMMQGHTMSVSTIEDARAALRRQWPGSSMISAPDDMPVMSCCVHEIGKRQMGCVTFEVDDVPVTMAVADAREIRSPHGNKRVIGDTEYVVGSADGVNMVMSQRDGVWTCVMGRLPLERLANVAASVGK